MAARTAIAKRKAEAIRRLSIAVEALHKPGYRAINFRNRPRNKELASVVLLEDIVCFLESMVSVNDKKAVAAKKPRPRRRKKTEVRDNDIN